MPAHLEPQQARRSPTWRLELPALCHRYQSLQPGDDGTDFDYLVSACLGEPYTSEPSKLRQRFIYDSLRYNLELAGIAEWFVDTFNLGHCPTFDSLNVNEWLLGATLMQLHRCMMIASIMGVYDAIFPDAPQSKGAHRRKITAWTKTNHYIIIPFAASDLDLTEMKQVLSFYKKMGGPQWAKMGEAGSLESIFGKDSSKIWRESDSWKERKNYVPPHWGESEFPDKRFWKVTEMKSSEKLSRRLDKVRERYLQAIVKAQISISANAFDSLDHLSVDP